MFQAQNRETTNSTWKVASVLQDDYDDVRDKIVFHKTTPDLQEQDHSVQDQDQDRFFLVSDRSKIQTGLVLRQTVSDHIAAGCRHRVGSGYQIGFHS